MCISIRSNTDITKLIKERISLFDPFECVYLFGSSLNPNMTPNDIDILVVYSRYSSKIVYALNNISDELGKASGLNIDLTALSIEEEKSTRFLNKVKPHYLKLK